MDNQHYACTGECGGVSPVPGNCQAQACSMHNQPLQPCTCDSPDHMDQLSGEGEEE